MDPLDQTGAVLHEEHADGLTTLRLNRPHRRHGLDRELGTRLLEAVVRASHDSAVRAVLLTGTDHCFCAGDDISGLRELVEGERAHTPSFPETGDAFYLRICEAMIQAPKPTIAAIDGAAVGAGAEIACAADYRLASGRARIGSGLIHLGHLGNAVMLARVVGPARATEIFLTGRLVEADEALRIGLVDRVVANDSFDRAAADLGRRLAHAPTKAIALFKELRERTWGQPIEYGLRMQDLYHVRACTETEDGTEGPAAYLERREPQFTGR
ncbi:enoyl-CoA hydratase/isomerase family protein [Phytoactinopolyspora limicola]|uniref:enoyl-CoA hydratase/isomerase family protein n=1 Tax=Phytoactinopolyspora limicola TaxID=2715536 RepID=UPI00140DB677|nr:enoyl-CoA hydratase-related protein [Phytoactinopolyspora limicola]